MAYGKFRNTHGEKLSKIAQGTMRKTKRGPYHRVELLLNITSGKVTIRMEDTGEAIGQLSFGYDFNDSGVADLLEMFLTRSVYANDIRDSVERVLDGMTKEEPCTSQ